jgi:putative ABC transport system permease protein
MFWTLIKKDFIHNKSINLILLIFVVISACLISVGTMIISQLFSSIDNMYSIAQPPHFLQMHVGDINEDEISNFANKYSYVDYWQVNEVTNLYGENIKIEKKDGSSYSLSNCLLHLGFVQENEKKDLLLDMNNNKIYPKKGEIGVPVILLNNYNINLGDKLIISKGNYEQEFTVTTFVRDPQMNSTLCSSTRFLVNPDDLQSIRNSHIGDSEYLIEFFFTDPSYAKDFQTAYEKAGMPANGQGLTYDIIRLISGLSDIIVVVVLILVSILLIFIAILCLRYTILATIEEDLSEIGNMKAIGISFKNIRSIYLLKYKIIAIAGCVLGYALSFMIDRMFASHIERTFGKPQNNILTFILPIFLAAIVYLIDISCCKSILNRIRTISVINTIRGETSNTKVTDKIRPRKDLLFKHKFIEFWIAARDVLKNAKSWSMMIFIIFLSTCIMVIPYCLLSTIKDPRFITYMGQKQCDIIMLISNNEGINENYENVINTLKTDSDVSNYSVEASVVYQAMKKDGEWTNIHVGCSDTPQNGLQYISGKFSSGSGEIALSKLNANELGVNVNDTITVQKDGIEKQLKVSGIYQDVTNGGYTAKMLCGYDQASVERYTFNLILKSGANIQQKVKAYQEKFGDCVEINEMDEFVNQTLGGVTSQLSGAVVIVYIMALLLAILITVLFLKLMIVKYHSEIVILKSIGFSVADIRKQYIIKILMIAILGIIAGLLFVGLLGEPLVSLIISISGLGLSNISFIINPMKAYVLFPIILLLVVIFSAWRCTNVFKKYIIVDLIKE